MKQNTILVCIRKRLIALDADICGFFKAYMNKEKVKDNQRTLIDEYMGGH